MTTQTTFTYSICNDELDDGFDILSDGSGGLHIVDYDCDGYPYRVGGTQPLPDYGHVSPKEIKAWACDELGWDTDDCSLELYVETRITELTVLC